MGNQDITFVFNDTTVITVLGKDYETRNEAIRIALERYIAKSDELIKDWEDAKKQDPKSVAEDFDPGVYWGIKIMRVF